MSGDGAKLLDAVPSPGLLRSALVGRKPAGTLRQLFGNLRELTRGEIIGEDPDRNAEASRLRVDRTDGHGSYELYRLDRDLFILTIDCLFDSVREEIVPGEALIEVHICLRGRLTMQTPTTGSRWLPEGPCSAAAVSARRRGRDRAARGGHALYRPVALLQTEFSRTSVAPERNRRLLVAAHGRAARSSAPCGTRRGRCRRRCITSRRGLLQSPYQQGFRLLHSEAKALEILCQVLSPAPGESEHAAATTTLVRQIDTVRRILSTQYAPIPHICELARRVGMSESKLKRAFKEHFGTTVFEYGLECRMRHALELLQANTMSICQVAESVGYQHQTSFTAAFRDHFGFLPSEARMRRAGRAG